MRLNQKNLTQITESVVQPMLDSSLESLMYNIVILVVEPTAFMFILLLVNLTVVAFLIYVKCRLAFLINSSAEKAPGVLSSPCRRRKKPQRFHRRGK